MTHVRPLAWRHPRLGLIPAYSITLEELRNDERVRLRKDLPRKKLCTQRRSRTSANEFDHRATKLSWGIESHSRAHARSTEAPSDVRGAAPLLSREPPMPFPRPTRANFNHDSITA